MAQIENTITQEIVFLHSQHLIGRNGHACNTLINNPDVSRLHATLYWSDGSWFIQDHSRNGTLVNGLFIRKSVTRLDTGSKLQFGSSDSDIWRVIDLTPPCSYLKSLTCHDKVIPLGTCHALPDDQKPELLFYKREDKSWILETSEGTVYLSNGSRFDFKGEEWMFIENEILHDTLDYGYSLQNTYFKFYISSNEEEIQLMLVVDGKEYDLGKRSYNYLLLALARQRLEDLQLGIASDNQGWLSTEALIKDISKEQGYEVDVYYLNLQIFRLRKQLVELKPFGHLLNNVIERKTGEIRFAFPQLEVIKNNKCIGKIHCDSAPLTQLSVTNLTES